MGDVFREVEFTYQGQAYSFVPDLNVLRRVKARGINGMMVVQQWGQGGVDPLDLVPVAREFLRAAGGEATDNDVYAWLVGGNKEELQSLYLAAVAAWIPQIDVGKKPEAPAQAKAKKSKPPMPRK